MAEEIDCVAAERTEGVAEERGMVEERDCEAEERDGVVAEEKEGVAKKATVDCELDIVGARPNSEQGISLPRWVEEMGRGE